MDVLQRHEAEITSSCARQVAMGARSLTAGNSVRRPYRSLLPSALTLAGLVAGLVAAWCLAHGKAATVALVVLAVVGGRPGLDSEPAARSWDEKISPKRLGDDFACVYARCGPSPRRRR